MATGEMKEQDLAATAGKRHSVYESMAITMDDGRVVTLLNETVYITGEDGTVEREAFVPWFVPSEYIRVALDVLPGSSPLYGGYGTMDYHYLKKVEKWLDQKVVGLEFVPNNPDLIREISALSVVSHINHGSLAWAPHESPNLVGNERLARVRTLLREGHRIKIYRRYSGPANRNFGYHDWHIKHLDGRIDVFGEDGKLERTTTTYVSAHESTHYTQVTVPAHVNGVYFHFQ